MSRGMQACLHTITLSKAMGFWVNPCGTVDRVLSVFCMTCGRRCWIAEGILVEFEFCQHRVFCLIKVCMLQLQLA